MYEEYSNLILSLPSSYINQCYCLLFAKRRPQKVVEKLSLAGRK